MRPFLAILQKELWSVYRDRTILIAVLIQLFIASFSSGLLLGVLSLYDPDTIMQSGSVNIKVGLVGPSDTPFKDMLLESKMQVYPYNTFADAQTAYYSGQVNAVVVIPQNVKNTAEIKLYLPDLDAVSSVIRMVIQGPLKNYENYLRKQNGIDVEYTDLKGKPATSFEFIYSVLLPMLMFFPAFVAGSMSVDTFTEEIENNTLQTLLSAPISINGVISAKIASSMVISTIQCIAWLVLMQLNGITFQNIPGILLLAVIVAGMTSTAAMLGAVLLKDRERAQFIYSLALLVATSLGTLLNVSPITVISRLGIGDHFTSGWNVAMFAAFLGVLYLLLMKTSRRVIA